VKTPFARRKNSKMNIKEKSDLQIVNTNNSPTPTKMQKKNISEI